MRALRRFLVALAILLIILQAPLAVCAEKTAPAITVYKLMSWPLTVKVYVESRSIDIATGEEFYCPAKDKVISVFYDAITRLRKSLLRFSDEHPEYAALTAITFVNVSSPEEADLILVVIRGWNASRALLYRSVDPRRANEIQITCDDAQKFSLAELRGVIMHELLHAFGIGHAHQMWTDYGEPEVMLNIQPDAYPTTLDLYAMYQLYFGGIDFAEDYKANVTLPEGLPYKMIVPYDVEIEKLRDENERLRGEINDLRRRLKQANDLIDELQENVWELRNYAENLTRENMELRAMNEALQEQLINTWIELQLTSQILDHYRMENERLKQNLTKIARMGLFLADYCNKTILELIEKNKGLRANLSATIEYARAVENALTFLRTSVIILGIAALILILLHYRSLKRAEAEEEEMEEPGGSISLRGP